MTGPQQGKHEEYISCIREKVLTQELTKGEVINPYRLKVLCGDDIRTAKDHLPDLAGVRIVEGMKLVELDTSAGPWLVIDPPEDEEWLSPVKTDNSEAKSDSSLGFVIAGFALGGLALLGLWALTRRRPNVQTGLTENGNTAVHVPSLPFTGAPTAKQPSLIFSTVANEPALF